MCFFECPDLVLPVHKHNRMYVEPVEQMFHGLRSLSEMINANSTCNDIGQRDSSQQTYLKVRIPPADQ